MHAAYAITPHVVYNLLFVCMCMWCKVHTHKHTLHTRYMGMAIEQHTTVTWCIAYVLNSCYMQIHSKQFVQHTCVTDSSPANNEDILHKRLLYCSHCLLKGLPVFFCCHGVRSVCQNCSLQGKVGRHACTLVVQTLLWARLPHASWPGVGISNYMLVVFAAACYVQG